VQQRDHDKRQRRGECDPRELRLGAQQRCEQLLERRLADHPEADARVVIPSWQAARYASRWAMA
jgi:hypothetical protein